MILETMLATPACLPILLWVVCCMGIAYEFWRDRTQGTIYERTARQIEAESDALRARYKSPDDKEI
jgi:hypothetical protein|uniref:Uncharacterized protein n=1 Tax=Myoviridae sp. ctshb19 TaxID=2825194 RepID=A0A8S5UGL2_9CAUD|nr:MAG TPA: hypothetical protein [Myoviridae sp. ctshb19]